MAFHRRYEFVVYSMCGERLFASVMKVISPNRLLVRVNVEALDQEMSMIAKKHNKRWIVKLKEKQIRASDAEVEYIT